MIFSIFTIIHFSSIALAVAASDDSSGVVMMRGSALKKNNRMLSTCIPNPSNCGCASAEQADYRGSINVTVTGKTCQNWSDQSPHIHSRTAQNYPDSGLKGNYCRNPDGVSCCY